MIPPDDDATGDDLPSGDLRDDDGFPEGEDGEAEEGGGDRGREPGYLWSFEEQEERLSGEYADHMEILDEMDASEVLALDLSRAGDYILWAAAQSLEEQGRPSEAIDLLRRLDAAPSPHDALCYPEIRLRLHDLLRDRGDYEEALALLARVEADDPARAEACRERRAEVLVLSGRAEEGMRLFERAASAIPDDPWVPLSAAWALVRAGEYDDALTWIGRGERAARRLEDEQETRTAMAEVDRLRDEARARQQRRERAGAAGAKHLDRPDEAGPRDSGPPPGAATESAASPQFEERRQSILADLDAEEVRLTRNPPQGDADREAALARLTALHRRASAAWDDAVEKHEDFAIAALEDVQWDVVEVAERFGLHIPDTGE